MDKNFNPVGWFELYVDDMARAKAFYQTVFQRPLHDLPPLPSSNAPMALFDMDMNASGTVLQPKMSIGDYGFVAMVRDTEGNVIGLHSRQ